jgi:hypothetical protein
VNQRDELFQRLQERVTTTSGWADLIRGIQHDNSQAYGVRQLCEWLRTKSGWSDDTAAKIGQAFRKAVLMIVGDEQEIWACAIDSLRVLAETITTDANDLTGEERAVFSRASKPGLVLEGNFGRLPLNVRRLGTKRSPLEMLRTRCRLK